jgi:SAM-dependent methyltransferase
MSKQGEKNYPLLIGAEGLAWAARKPFSSPDCHDFLCRIAVVMQLLPPPPARVLDLGCGTGWTSLFLARRGYDVVGVDIAAGMIEVAEQLRLQEGLDNLRFVEADYEEAGFDSEFDAAVFFDSLHHAVDEEQALRAVWRALRPGGVCVTDEPGEGHSAVEHTIHAVQTYDVTEKDMPPRHIIAVARRAGFTKAHVFPHLLENTLVPYVRSEGTAPRFGRRLHDPCRDAGLFKRLFHRMVRWRLGLRPATYAGLISSLPELAGMIESSLLGQKGVALLEK